ncbi:MAG: VTT domain-containing protein [Dermatophilus congolensis]|nr:VTT domain-containing protein [Dermatophilus congolensis]
MSTVAPPVIDPAALTPRTVSRAAARVPEQAHAVTAGPFRLRAETFRSVSRYVTVVGLAAIALAVALGIGSGVLTSVASLREFVAGFGVFAPAAFVLVGALEAVFPVIPGSGAILAAPILFGTVSGTVYAYLATCLGSMLVFAISRYAGRDLMAARFSPSSLERYAGWLEHPKFARYFGIAIAMPFAPDDLLCYFAGLTKMRWRTYVAIILACKPWGVLLYTTGMMTILKAVFPWLGL